MTTTNAINTDSIARVRASLPSDLEGFEMSACCDIAERNDPSDCRLGYAVAMVEDWMARKNLGDGL